MNGVLPQMVQTLQHQSAALIWGADVESNRCWGVLLGVVCRLLLMCRFHVFYSAMLDVGSGCRPVKAADAYESEQVVQWDFPLL